MVCGRVLNVLLVWYVLVFFPAIAHGWIPPNGSPLAQGLHPRIFFIPDSYRSMHPDAFGMTVGEYRAKLVGDSSLSTKFQSFVSTMDLVFNNSPSSKTKMYATYDAINFSLLYLLDPAILGAPPYNYSFKHTKDEYGNKAIDHAIYISTAAKNETIFKNIWADIVTFSYGKARDGATNLSLAIVNDWVNDKISKSQRQQFVDAVKNIYDLRSNILPLASGSHFGYAQNGDTAALGFYGDDIDIFPGTTYKGYLDIMLDSFNTNWIVGFKDLTNKVYGNGSSSVQGLYYGMIATKNMNLMLLAMSTALNRNFFSEVGYLKYMPYYLLYNTLPRPRGGKYFYFSTDDMKPYSSNIVSFDWGRYSILFNPIIYGLKNEETDLASLFLWYRDISGFLQTEAGSNIRYFMIPQLLFGNNSVVPKSPSELNVPFSKRVGNGEYYLRTGFSDADDTLVTFFATKYHVNDSGHAHRDFAGFEIRKYGDLVLSRQIAKGFSGGNYPVTQNSMWYNTIGVHKPGELVLRKYNDMGYRGGYSDSELDPNASAYFEGGANHVGTIKHEDLNNGAYDYIDYNYSNAWSPQKVDYAEREFVYLRSAGGVNDEFVVVFDRISSVQPYYTKYFLLHSSYEPRLLTNGHNEITMTAEDYPNDSDGIGGGRWVNKNSTPLSNNVIEITNTWNGSHGRLFNKTLSPSSFQINKTGGPGHYWEDSEGQLIWSGTLSNSEEKNYRGTYTMQIQSTTGSKFDVFLNVMQIGDSDTLTSMTPVKKISATGKNGNMMGTLIEDSTKNRVVLFNPADPASISKIQPGITYTITTTAESHHLLFNTSVNTLYSVNRNGALLTTVQSSGGGVVSFEDPGIGTNVVYQIDMAGSAVGEYPSEPQGQIEVQTFGAPDKVRLRWYQSKDDNLAGNIYYKIYYDASTTFSSPSVISNPVVTSEDTDSGRIYTAYFSPVSGSQYFYKVASVNSTSGKESSLDFVSPVAASFATPSVSSFSVSDLSSGDTNFSDNAMVSVSANANDPQGAGTIVKWLIKESSSPPSTASLNAGNSSMPSTYTIKVSEGAVNLYLWVMDQDGNISQPATAKITLLVPPAAASDFQVK